MNNRNLERRIDALKREFESIVDELVSELEKSETDNDMLKDELKEIKEENTDMGNKITELETELLDILDR